MNFILSVFAIRIRSYKRSLFSSSVAVLVPAILLAGASVPSLAIAQTEVDFPLGIGLHLPSYDRVNGLSLPFGPTVIFGDGRLKVGPTITYRSHLGKIDPRLRADLRLDSTFKLQVSGERGTFTNEAWVRSNFRNSLVALIGGRDARNYYRADRAEGRVVASFGDWEYPVATVFGGARFENAWSTGWRDGERARGPFSFRHNEYAAGGMARANPLIDRGHTASALAGGSLRWQNIWTELKADGLVESAWKEPNNGKFTQFTVNGSGIVHTAWGQRFESSGHLVITAGDSTPLQRYVYLGGSGTIPTTQILSMGGDRLFLWDINYVIPIPGAEIPYLGPVSIGPRFITGAAGLRAFGPPAQNYGLRLGLGFVQIDYLQDVKSSKRRALDISINILQ